MFFSLHPASDLPADSGEAWSRDQVCHPEEEPRWPCPECGGYWQVAEPEANPTAVRLVPVAGRGCVACDNVGVLGRGDSRYGDRYAPEHPYGMWVPMTPAQRDSFDGRIRDVGNS